MKLYTAFALLAGARSVLAAPSSLPDGVSLVPRESRIAERKIARKTNPRLDVDGSLHAKGNNISNVEYSSNWAGAVLIGSGYKSVTGTITVPTIKAPTGGSSRTDYAGSAWVGIDGDTCSSSILQTGIEWDIQGGVATYSAWYEWFPDYSYTFSGFSVKAGDSIKMTVTATSKSAGSATIQNLSTGKTVTHSFSGQTAQLCETNAEWIVEDFESNGQLVPLANWGTVTFTGASVTTTSGSTVGVTGSDILDIKQNNKVYSDCSTSGSSSVTCKYTG